MASVPRPVRPFERPFYLGVTFLFLALVFWTFSRTFYLKTLFGTPALPLLLHVHAVAMTGWVVLLAVQASLIASHRVQWHRRVGVFGAVWAAFVVVMGSVTTIHAAVREVQAHTARAESTVYLMTLDLLQMLLFAGYVTTAILMRRRPDYHKRLMLLTVGCMLPDALARLPVSFMTNGLILLGLDGFVLGCILIDTIRYRRLHPALGWGGLLFMVTFHVALVAAGIPGWIHYVSGLLA